MKRHEAAGTGRPVLLPSRHSKAASLHAAGSKHHAVSTSTAVAVPAAATHYGREEQGQRHHLAGDNRYARHAMRARAQSTDNIVLAGHE
jgi:hypothetical protein